MFIERKVKQMEKIEFAIADGTKCQGYLLEWQGLSFGITSDREDSSNGWSVFELQSGFSVTGKQVSTRKQAIKEALEILNSKGIKAVKKRLKEIFAERGSTRVNGKTKIAHCTTTNNRPKTLCGRIKNGYCLPIKYFSYAKRPCKRCQRIVEKSKSV